jgi:aspartyl-tRNA(Asn)/glutamyl-tRNA(Gln) amidotransferase subunit A
VNSIALTGHELSQKLAEGELSSLEITEAYLKQIRENDPTLCAYITLDEEEALRAAKEADEKRAQGKAPSRISGIPLAIKDNMCVKNLPCTCGSKILSNFIAPYDATVVERLKKAGAVILGKTNCDEFSMGSSTENSAFFPTRNPWDTTRVPGGSSGGSACAVAAGEAPWALGSDTGGSIRQPAAFCGITGLKPTYGLVSRYGLVAYASSLDQIGVLARDVRDCALLLQSIAGHDERDSTSADLTVPDYLDGSLNLAGPKPTIGIAREFFSPSLDQGVANVIREAIECFNALGFTMVDVTLPHIAYALPAYYIIAPAEASSNLARYDGARYGYRTPHATDIMDMFKKSRKESLGREVKRRIMLGTYTLSAGYYDAYYLKAQKIRTLIKQDFDQCFTHCDCIIGPTTPTTAFRLGENMDDPLKMYLSDIYTVSVNLAGLPGLVLPAGFSENMPVGLQLIGKAFDEPALLAIGEAFQKATDHHLKRPPSAQGALR